MLDVNGLAAKFFFHSRGVSCATSRAGWVDPLQHVDPQVYGFTSCMRHVETRLWMSMLFQNGPTFSGFPFLVALFFGKRFRESERWQERHVSNCEGWPTL